MAEMASTEAGARPAEASGTFLIGGDMRVHRLGFGAMRITGEGVWGEPEDRDECLAVLRRTIELGIDLIDTADSYGPYVSEELIREALHPYPTGLVIATKAGLVRTAPGKWHPLGRPEYLRQECEMSLRRLGVDRIDLYQLHRVDSKVPADEQFGLLEELRQEGKIRHVGLSEVSVEQIKAARKIVPIATGELAKDGGPLDALSSETGATPAQLALAWLLHRSPVVLPIPGTSSVAHLEENVAAAAIPLSDEQYRRLLVP
jgi:aryl-alcohol dehydrogenase-like predicted oxidoreductase